MLNKKDPKTTLKPVFSLTGKWLKNYSTSTLKKKKNLAFTREIFKEFQTMKFTLWIFA